MINYFNFSLIAQNEEEKVIVVKLGFKNNEIITIQPEEWPTNLDEFLKDTITSLYDPAAIHLTPGESEEEVIL